MDLTDEQKDCHLQIYWTPLAYRQAKMCRMRDNKWGLNIVMSDGLFVHLLSKQTNRQRDS